MKKSKNNYSISEKAEEQNASNISRDKSEENGLYDRQLK